MEDMEQIYREYMPQVYKYLFSLCRDAQTAEELTQETFYQAVKSIDHFRGECKLYVWLCQIAKHLWNREIRRRNRENLQQLEEEMPSAGAGIPEKIIEKEERMELYKSLHKLEENVREVMYLRISGEFSFREIGEILGKDENWARVTFYRGKQRVRKELLKNEM
ncbi:MAG TPA: sigma-70 family RNA polymerase sigma factor [Candidatus Blautia merdavium]|uniref:Sigma-70 family RNA polymerase sigma factor n=1 Tax=Candidatus Blautia merdavium TaxID=2838494 RepID=A0A9D2PQL5_9FIRM|nr:sigma-70 family RNA polymerase sigma factor [Candidatus Blautia merdavium]